MLRDVDLNLRKRPELSVANYTGGARLVRDQVSEGVVFNVQGASRMQWNWEKDVKAVGMGERYLVWLLAGMKRLHEAFGRFWNRQAPPPEVPQSERFTDQW